MRTKNCQQIWEKKKNWLIKNIYNFQENTANFWSFLEAHLDLSSLLFCASDDEKQIWHVSDTEFKWRTNKTILYRVWWEMKIKNKWQKATLSRNLFHAKFIYLLSGLNYKKKPLWTPILELFLPSYLYRIWLSNFLYWSQSWNTFILIADVLIWVNGLAPLQWEARCCRRARDEFCYYDAAEAVWKI